MYIIILSNYNKTNNIIECALLSWTLITLYFYDYYIYMSYFYVKQ